MKYAVQVRNGDHSLVTTINVVLRVESCGNFNPTFCTYKGKRRLVESDSLHLDDPLRFNEKDHINQMFIRPRNIDGIVVATWDLAK